MNVISSDTISGLLLPCVHIYHGAYSLWQVWNLESRQLVYCLQWEANMTAFAVVQGTYLMCATDTDLQMIWLHLLSAASRLVGEFFIR